VQEISSCTCALLNVAISIFELYTYIRKCCIRFFSPFFAAAVAVACDFLFVSRHMCVCAIEIEIQS